MWSIVSKETYHDKRRGIEAACLQKGVQGHERGGMHNAADGRLARPLPRTVPVPEDDTMRNFKRLPVLVRLEHGPARGQRTERMRQAPRTEHGRQPPLSSG